MEAMGSEETFFYFSFGSNMLKERITIHNPDATFYKVAKLKVCRSPTLPCFTEFSETLDTKLGDLLFYYIFPVQSR